ncbi:hemerythrin domain-containing protein [Marivirga sp. S37H4]|uniref:Hemerythrin domain-containing protein n=1 Tax=Marivirga aurantiaca TaxID=2802615 RepID=A0A935C6W5_9BACT|nr:hemerythrin domain-containing protein [Marivirga aurantiaca]MBK6263997.1 hemerythrin domain-containing protein [Marivirga aurantiaca]
MENEKKKPLKRSPSLVAFSREHHHSLLLCWKIRMAFRNGIDVNRIKKYSDWFYKTHMISHFEVEEEYIFSVLGRDDELVKQAMTEHRRLKRLFEDTTDPEKSLSLIEEELEKHIRFEERALFQKVQQIASPEQLETIKEHHRGLDFVENETDVFWK